MIKKIRTFISILVLMTMSFSCSNDDELIGVVWATKYVYCFTDKPDTGNEIETMSVGSSAQNLDLKVKKLLASGFSMPEKLFLTVDFWNDEKREWETDPSYSNSTDIKAGFYHIISKTQDGEAVINVELDANESFSERRIRIYSISDQVVDHVSPFGNIEIIQQPAPQSFLLKAKFKGNVYSTMAELDSEGNFLYRSEEYAQLMREIDSNPDVQMVVMDDSTIHYYDSDDIAANQPYEDIRSLVADNGNTSFTTRADGFEYQESEDLGYMAMYDNDHFAGKMHYKGLANYHFTYNIPSMKPMGLNDKITSIAVGYNGPDPIVCTVLTIWEDTDYNHGDDNRSKHRISIVASQNNPKVSLPDLKKIKKIGSSKSWNDCISAFSLHFGYIDRFLLDY